MQPPFPASDREELQRRLEDVVAVVLQEVYWTQSASWWWYAAVERAKRDRRRVGSAIAGRIEQQCFFGRRLGGSQEDWERVRHDMQAGNAVGADVREWTLTMSGKEFRRQT